MHENKNLFSDDELDRAIRESLRIETDQARLDRLERYWRDNLRKQNRRRLALWAAPLAAAALAAVAAFIVVGNRQQASQSAEAVRDDATSIESVQTEAVQTDRVKPESVEVAANSPPVSRPPTTYERVMFAARTREWASAKSDISKIEEAIYQFAVDPTADGGQLIESTGLSRSHAEELLLRKLRDADERRQVAILRLLAVCGDQRSLPALLRLGERENLRDEVIATIEQIVGIDHLPLVVERAFDPELRASLMHRLLAADSEKALMGYLLLVRNDSVRAEALAVAEQASPLPIEALLRLLDHQEKRVRIAAAMVLGHVNGPEITQLLIARVTRKPADSTEAWLALLSCRDILAQEFFAYATHRPQLLGHYNNARIQWTRMIP